LIIRPATAFAIALPVDPEYPRMLVDFATAAERNGVRINSVSFSEPKLNVPTKDKLDPMKGSVIPLSLSLSLKAGTYTGVKRMLADVESNLRLMDITGISLNASTEGGFDYNVQIRSYMFLPPGVNMLK
jgi:Tfp pilus assembly protein PilO